MLRYSFGQFSAAFAFETETVDLILELAFWKVLGYYFTAWDYVYTLQGS